MGLQREKYQVKITLSIEYKGREKDFYRLSNEGEVYIGAKKGEAAAREDGSINFSRTLNLGGQINIVEPEKDVFKDTSQAGVLYNKAEEYGADRVHIADTIGAITPQGMKYLMTELRKEVNIDITLHCHNDFGLAVINSITGLLYGANGLSTTVNGIGERAGNASLEEVIMALRILYGKDLGFKGN